MQSNPVSRSRSKLLAAAASLAIAGAIGIGAVTTNTAPVLAEAVRLQAPAQMPGFADVVEKVSPAVVSVRVKSKIEPASNNGFSFNMPGFDDLPDDHPMKRFFRDFRGGPRFGDQDRQERQERQGRRGGRESLRPSSQGSGFFISEEGYLVTNSHVVNGGAEYTVVMDDGAEFDATLVGADSRTDLAVLKVDADRKFTYVAFADDSRVRVGDWVVAVGNPFGLGGTVTAGIVSARGRDIGAGPYDDFIQIDAAVNRGNSGGPAFNLSGEVVGINTAIFSPSGGNVGIAFAIPASTARDVVNSLISSGTVERGWLGVQIQPVTKEIADSLGMTETRGALVSLSQDGSPAKAAGIREGDVVTTVNGKAVATPRELARVVAGIAPNQDAEVGIWRDGKAETITVKIGEMPAGERQAAVTAEPESEDAGATLESFGLTVTPAEDGAGLVVTDVEPGSNAAERGISAGDVILSVNSREVSSAGDVDRAVEEASNAGRSAVLVRVKRDENSRFVALPVAKG